jgi:hypothetical protein
LIVIVLAEKGAVEMSRPRYMHFFEPNDNEGVAEAIESLGVTIEDGHMPGPVVERFAPDEFDLVGLINRADGMVTNSTFNGAYDYVLILTPRGNGYPQKVHMLTQEGDGAVVISRVGCSHESVEVETPFRRNTYRRYRCNDCSATWEMDSGD